MSVYDQYQHLDDPMTRNVIEVMITFKAMYAEAPGSAEHAAQLEAFASAAEPMTPFERGLFERMRDRHLAESTYKYARA
jgi:hypothetical protein